jgi:hypothetical protein
VHFDKASTQAIDRSLDRRTLLPLKVRPPLYKLCPQSSAQTALPPSPPAGVSQLFHRIIFVLLVSYLLWVVPKTSGSRGVCQRICRAVAAHLQTPCFQYRFSPFIPSYFRRNALSRPEATGPETRLTTRQRDHRNFSFSRSVHFCRQLMGCALRIICQGC